MGKYWIRAKKAWDKMSAEEKDERMKHLTEQWKKKKEEQKEEQKEAENYAEDHVEEAAEKDHAENHAAALLQTSAASSPESNWGPMDLIRAKKAWDKMSAEEKDEQMKYWIRAKKAWDKMSAEEKDERMKHLTEQWKKKK